VALTLAEQAQALKLLDRWAETRIGGTITTSRELNDLAFETLKFLYPTPVPMPSKFLCRPETPKVEYAGNFRDNMERVNSHTPECEQSLSPQCICKPVDGK
jgi:hypothetical protein